MSREKQLVAIAALLGTLSVGAAQAGGVDEIRWSVTIGSPVPVRVHVPGPVYAPAPVYRPAPPPVYAPAPVYGRHPAPEQYRVVYREPTRWDIDGDGIPNHRDRVYNPHWDVDGDGIPNRRDVRPGHPHRGGWGR